MIDRVSIKERSMRMFKNNYWLCVALFAVLAAVTGAVSGISTIASNLANIANIGKGEFLPSEAVKAFTGVSLVLSLFGLAASIFVGGPLSVSSSKAAVNIYDGNRPSFRDVLFGFTNGMYWKSVGVTALLMLFTMLAAFAMIIPMAIVIAVIAASMAASGAGEQTVQIVLVLMTIVSVIVMMIPIIIVALGLSQTHYLVADDDRTGMDAIRQSWKLMRGHKWEYFVFTLSFLGWQLLNVLTFGVLGIFYVGPYISIAHGGYYRELVRSEEPVVMGDVCVDDNGY